MYVYSILKLIVMVSLYSVGNMESDTKNIKNSTMNTLLKGFICVTEYRSWNVACQKQTHVLCRRFWEKDPIIVATDENNQCQYHEVNTEKYFTIFIITITILFIYL